MTTFDDDPDDFMAELLTELRRAASTRLAAEALHRRLSPRMRGAVGSVADLERTLGNTLFAPLLAGGASEQHPAERLGDAARVRVRIGLMEGESAPFLFSLARLPDERGNPRWQLTGLAREDAL